jgi:hypothetical protein
MKKVWMIEIKEQKDYHHGNDFWDDEIDLDLIDGLKIKFYLKKVLSKII